ncbi:MAG: acyl-ACP--UDP-N-acetylglucosamine O-acyltransferase [Puniceicoccales bacterium]|jgi:UDP-N-acetylglucosamine acyltransferase|nr:acyl-ACP--UDP-N-acetylglucosamine O-acyltransferase [Puniceicoccales bacterium]
MARKVHPTAIVEPGAQLGDGVEVGAYAFVGSRVVLGDGCLVHHHGTVQGNAVLGAENEIFPFAMIGGKTQDLKYRGGDPPLCIGDRNTFREFVSVHCATFEEVATTIGNDNHIFAYAHVAHECTLGNHIIISSQAVLGGHVQINSHANIGGASAVHQFCKIGAHAMLAGGSALVQDLPPYMIAEGNRARIRAYNKIGLQRNGFTEDEIAQVRHLFRILYENNLNVSDAIKAIDCETKVSERIKRPVLDFYDTSLRGVVH